jgi:hypothetical protein
MIIKAKQFGENELFVEGNAHVGFYVVVDKKRYDLASLTFCRVDNPQKRLYAMRKRGYGSIFQEIDANNDLQTAMAITEETFKEGRVSGDFLCLFNENYDWQARKFDGKSWEVRDQ